MKSKSKLTESKVLILIAAFIGTAIITFISMNFEASEMYTTTMKSATLPVVEMVADTGIRYNQLRGYTSAVDDSLINESLTPLPTDKKLGIAVNTYGSQIEKIAYKVRSLTDHSLIENTEVSSFTQSDNTVDAVLNIKNLIDDNTQYSLEIILSTEEHETISYYTRIVSGADMKLADKVKFAKEFNSYCFNSDLSNNMLEYIETSPEGNNTNYGKVNINCTQSQISWGNLKPVVESQIKATVKDISNDVVILYLEYTMGAENEYDSYDTYHVSEYYRRRQTSTDMYLLNFEREANQVFDGKNDLTSSSKINLGIHPDTDVNMMADQTGVNTYFVNEGTLWGFNSATKAFTNVFTFTSDESDNVRELYGSHNFKIMNVTDSGDCDFLVYGYMNRGEHEGNVGVSLCSYSYEQNQVVERLFLPVDVPYEILEDNVGAVSNLSGNDFYLLMDDTLYSIDLISKEVMVEVSGLVDGTFATSENGSMIAYSTNGSMNQSPEIRVFNMERRTDYFVKAADGDYLKALGFVGTDFIYGMAHQSDILEEQSGIITFPIYQVNIMDVDYQIIKEYTPQGGAYVSDAVVEKMRITLSRIAKNDDGTYSSTSIDQLINRDENNAEEGLLSEIGTTTARQQELYIVLMKAIDGIDGVSLRVSREVVFNLDTTPDMDYKFTGQNRYYVYGYGRFCGSYTSMESAINKAYDTYGMVMDYNGREIWNRYKTATAGISGLSVTAVDSAESLEYAVAAVATYAGNREDMVALMNAGTTAKAALEHVAKDQTIVVKGVSVEKMLSFISAGQPVIARDGADSYVIITGYDTTDISYIDMETGNTVSKKVADANKIFALWENVFITYYR
ncbi:MAG: hypothetical protein PHW47_00945 [Lachnospira sp.]|nr:hypothetical protein [Lachnospira sp.]